MLSMPIRLSHSYFRVLRNPKTQHTKLLIVSVQISPSSEVRSLLSSILYQKRLRLFVKAESLLWGIEYYCAYESKVERLENGVAGCGKTVDILAARLCEEGLSAASAFYKLGTLAYDLAGVESGLHKIISDHKG